MVQVTEGAASEFQRQPPRSTRSALHTQLPAICAPARIAHQSVSVGHTAQQHTCYPATRSQQAAHPKQPTVR